MPLDPDSIRAMAERYADAWSSHDGSAVASFFAEQGRLRVNGGEPVVGRDAIAELARGFFDQLPDLVVTLDGLRTAGDHALFLWTLEGTGSGDGGSGSSVRIGGWEAWELSDRVEIVVSDGRFDAQEYERQLSGTA